jgi:hypothetical protein
VKQRVEELDVVERTRCGRKSRWNEEFNEEQK